MNGGQLVVAYHGCDVTLRDDLVSGRIPYLDRSDNEYDWLGPGAYFFENDKDRALIFARASADNPAKMYTKRAIATPAVVGAVLCVNNVLDMTTQRGILEFQVAYKDLVQDLTDNGFDIPVNCKAGDDDTTVLLRKLDRAVFVNLHDLRDIASEKERTDNGIPLAYPPYDMVRGAFQQGEPVAPSSAFSCHSHIQLALVNEKCVVGWFLPPGDKLLSEEELHKARLRLRSAGASRKPRMRPSVTR